MAGRKREPAEGTRCLREPVLARFLSRRGAAIVELLWRKGVDRALRPAEQRPPSGGGNAGRHMLIRYGYEMTFTFGTPTPMVCQLDLHPSCTPSLRAEKAFAKTPYVESWGYS